jgi:DNA-directed RNA polymerase specialized sigma24 family protein
MENSKTLDKKLNEYRQGTLSRKDMEAFLFMHVREHIRRYKPEGMNCDTCSEYASWLYPRLCRAIDRYRERGASFDVYINTMVKFSAREYRTRQKEHHVIEQTWWDAKAEEMMACAEEEPDYFEPGEEFSEVNNPKQVLALLLKSYYYMSDDYLSRAAPAIGLTKEELGNMVDTLRNQRLHQEEEIRKVQEKIHCLYYRCLTFEKRMLNSSPGSSDRQKMKKSFEGAKRRLSAMRKHLASMRFEAPNWQIANIMGVPKGTIDSNLHALKQNQERNHTAQ